MKYLILLAVGMWAILLSQGGCTNAEARADTTAAGELKEEIAKAKAVEAKVVNVKVEKVTHGSLTEFVVARGVTVPKHDITYSAEVSGKLGKLTAQLGDRVKKGQMLALIDYETLAAQAKQAQANYDLAKTTYERLMQLQSEDLVSQQQIDETQSRLTAAQAQLTIAKSQLSKSRVRASRSGIVAHKYVEKAEFVAPGTRLYNIIDYDTVFVEAQLAETQVSLVGPEDKVRVEIGGLGETFDGIVDTIIPSADKVSKTFTLRVEVDNPELKILVGMSSSVSIAAETHENAIVINQNTVVEGLDGRSVFVAENNVAKKRRVDLGPIEDDRVIVLGGLSIGDDLIVVGHRDLMDKQPITIVE